MRKETVEELDTSSNVADRLAGLVASLPIAAVIVARNDLFGFTSLACNDAFATLHAILDSQQGVSPFILERDRLAALLASLESGEKNVSERWCSSDLVDPREIDISAARLNNMGVNGDNVFLISFVDRTAEIQNQRNLHREMLSDSLTGLYNRTGFEEAVDNALSHSDADGQNDENFAIIAIDLSRFSQINEYAGAIVGDELIVTVASRLKNILRGRDILARIGGNEFAIFARLSDDAADIDAICARLTSVFDAPYSLSGLQVNMDAAIGIGVGKAGNGDPSDTIRQAQIALKQAKRTNKIELYRKEVLDTFRMRFSLETDLRHALDNDALSLAYQPLIDLSDGRVIGFEALARWEHPVHGMIDPGDFIAVAEECGLIVPLGKWVLSKAVHSLKEWDDAVGFTLPIGMNVNLSAVQFARDDVAQSVRDVLEEANIDGKRLTLELTESAILSDPDRAAQAMHALKALNTCLAMDDFGTGYSNLAYLQKLPIDILKIDRSFVTEMLQDRDSVSIVRAVLSLANALGMETTAEGIETVELSNTLAALGCTHGQGYYYSRPLSADDALAYYLERSAKV
ncbi:MAG: bifunctional diguanylate cyclase/phosphodiesterase [Pseudomonadota bacterium]